LSDTIDIYDIISPVLGLLEPEAPTRQTKITSDRSACRHRQIRLDGDQRTVTCTGCGKALDAFDVLLDYGRGERSWRTWDSLISAAAQNLERLKTEERKTKARLQHASRKDALAAVDEERVRTERMRLEITERARDIGQLCRRIEQLAHRRGS
jgi:hypothetical protein